MSIQSNINSAISLAGVLASMNPELQAMGERAAQIRQLTNKQKGLAKTREALTAEGKKIAEKAAGTYSEYHTSKGAITSVELKGDPSVRKDIEAYEAESADLKESERGTAKELFELDPSRERYSAYRDTYGADPTAFDIKMGLAEGRARSERNLAKAERRVDRWKARHAATDAAETRDSEIAASREVAGLIGRTYDTDTVGTGLKPKA